jgi:hypothetical protein
VQCFRTIVPSELVLFFDELGVAAGDWWEMDLGQVGRNMMHGLFDDFASASTINGKLGDLFNCSGEKLLYI